MHFTCRSFVGKNNPQNWSQYWENEPDDFQLKSQKGHLFGLVNISSSNSDDLISLGHDFISKVNQKYFSTDLQLDILSSLKKTISNIEQDPYYQDLKIDLTLAIILDKKVFIASTGSNKVTLNRNSQISFLIKGDQLLNFISGQIKPKDKIFLMTSDFFNKITWEKIKSTLFDENIQNIEETFISLIYSLDDQDKISSALIEVNEEVDTAKISSDLPQPNMTIPTDDDNNIQIDAVKPVFVENQQPRQISKRKKVQVIVAIFLLIGLFISSYFGYQKNKKINTESTYQQLKTELESQLNNISLVKSMNLESAQIGAKESQKIVEQMVKLGVHTDEVEKFQSQIGVILSQTGVNENFIPDLFFDTSLIINNPQYKDIYLNKNSLYLLDPTNGRIDSLSISEKSSKSVLISENIKSSKKIFGDTNKLYLLFSDHISQINDSSIDSQISFSDSDPNPVATDVQIWNGSIYLIDNSNNTVWKFSPSSSGFSKAQNWLKNDKNLSLSPISLSIDGEIWVLYQDGSIENYVSGVKDNFSLSGSNQFSQTTSLDVSLDDDGHLAFVDNQNLIFVYKKSGDFIAKYNLGQLKVVDLTINGNILYLLASDQKIYKISL